MTDFQMKYGCNDCKVNNCINRILYILSVLAALGLGIITGVLLAETFLVALPAIIASTIILIILVIITAIYRRCTRSDCNNCGS